MKTLYRLYTKTIRLSDRILWPFVNLSIRLYMSNIFWKSGVLRYQDFTNGQWQNQVTAFTDYHPIPGIPGEISSIAATVGELALPVMLAFGVFTRLGAGGLLIMTAVIQFIVPESYGVANSDHYMWMLLLAVPLLKGGDVLSGDYILCKFFCKKQA